MKSSWKTRWYRNPHPGIDNKYTWAVVEGAAVLASGYAKTINECQTKGAKAKKRLEAESRKVGDL